jgi:drug/metabolite transporter (DMT)-like permease
MCSGLANLYLRKLRRDTATLPIMFWFLAMGTILTMPGQLYFGTPPVVAVVPLLLGLGLLALGVQFFKTTALAKAPTPVVVPVFYTMLLWNAAFDVLIWHQTPPQATCLGGAIIIAANLFILWRERRGPATAQ